MLKTFSLTAAAFALALTASSAFASEHFNHDGIYNVPGQNTTAAGTSRETSTSAALNRYVAIYHGNVGQSASTSQPYSHADEGTFNGN